MSRVRHQDLWVQICKPGLVKDERLYLFKWITHLFVSWLNVLIKHVHQFILHMSKKL